MNKVITIKMPKESLQLWLKALRSGKYEQGKGRMRTGDGKYCCLGVMQHCITGKVESSSSLLVGAAGLPSPEWLTEHNIEFAGRTGGDLGYLPSPFLPTLDLSAYTANDCGKYNFAQIADAIEACAEGV
jgi:hypothetical protein